MSNPCIELWFLYHYKNQKAHIDSQDCIRELSNRNKNTYKKGVIDEKLRSKLTYHGNKAYERAKASDLFENPSSNMFKLIDELERVYKER